MRSYNTPWDSHRKTIYTGKPLLIGVAIIIHGKWQHPECTVTENLGNIPTDHRKTVINRRHKNI